MEILPEQGETVSFKVLESRPIKPQEAVFT